MSKRRRSRGRPGGYGGPDGGYAQGPQGPGGYQGGGYGRRRGRYRRGGGGGGGPPPAGAGAVGMDGEGMRPPELEPEVGENGEPIPLEPGCGVLEMHPNGYGFLRSADNNYTRERTDPFVPATMIDRYRLREGVFIKGLVQPGRRQQQGPRVREIQEVEGLPPDDYVNVKTFDQLTPINPETWLRLETGQQPITTRVMDLLTPLGKGQRALIVAPPRTGKTILLQNIANAITENHPEVVLLVLLIDERPEEVTDMARSVKGEVVSSTFDEPAQRHVQIADMVIEKAKRLVEHKRDVVILLDSITRLARAYNTVVPPSGKILSGGVDANALHKPKRFFGAARNVEEGGSLTIIGTALIETGSRMDEVIFEEFKGTGNHEIVLDRKLAERRIYPAMDIKASGTRKEDLLLEPDVMQKVWALRRVLNPLNSVEAMEFLLSKMEGTKSNKEFLDKMKG